MNSIQPIEPLIVRVRGHRVILDADLARLYGVTTSALNQAVKRNAERFPQDFSFQLTVLEAANLKSQIVTSSLQQYDSKGKKMNLSQIVTGSQKHRDPKLLPTAFTEHGALMAANILRSEQAVQMSVFVIRAFVRMREHVAAKEGRIWSAGACSRFAVTGYVSVSKAAASRRTPKAAAAGTCSRACTPQAAHRFHRYQQEMIAP